MQALLKLSRAIDALNENVGKATIWLVLVVTLISALNAFVRYGFNYSSNGFLEIQWYLFSAIFLLCAGYALKRNAHVRIDVVSSHFSPRVLAWIDIVGTIFFLRRWPARCSTCLGRSSSIPSSARSIPPTPVA